MSEELTTAERAKAVIDRNKPYLALWDNSDFQMWRERVVEGRLDQWKEDVMSGRLPQEDVMASIKAYTKVRDMFDGFFANMQKTVNEMREVIKEES